VEKGSTTGSSHPDHGLGHHPGDLAEGEAVVIGLPIPKEQNISLPSGDPEGRDTIHGVDISFTPFIFVGGIIARMEGK
jgi:hypothetical protein